MCRRNWLGLLFLLGGFSSILRGWQLREPTDFDKKKQEDGNEQERGPMGLGDAGPHSA